MLVLVSIREKIKKIILQNKLIKGIKYHREKSLNLFRKWRWMGTSDNLLLKNIKNCHYRKKCENQLQAWKPIPKSKNYTNIVFSNCDAILYVLSLQKYKNIDLKLDFLNCSKWDKLDSWFLDATWSYCKCNGTRMLLVLKISIMKT